MSKNLSSPVSAGVPGQVRLLVPLLALALTGCASLSPDESAAVADVQALMQTAQGDPGAVPVLPPTVASADVQAAQDLIERRSAEILQAPLTAETAIELAFLRNRQLQASFARLGVAQADLVQAGRLRNPTFHFGRIGAGGVHEIDRAFVLDVLGLITLPWVKDVESRRHAQAQMQTALDALSLATQVRLAWIDAVAAGQLLHYDRQVLESAQLSTEVARRMVKSGGLNELALLREQAFEQSVQARSLKAGHEALVARERLTRWLALPSPEAFRLPERLPDLPARPLNLPDAEQTAMDRRLDLKMARLEVERTARSLGLSRSTRLVNVLDAGYQSQSPSGDVKESGYEISLELPLFDFGQSRVARAEAVYREALHRTAQQAIEARSHVRVAHSAYRSQHALALHYRDEVVPVRQRLSEQNVLRYNGMFISVFELLADAREQVVGVTAAIESQRDFWRADALLQGALTAGLPDGGGVSAASSGPGPLPAASGGGGH